MSAISTTNRAQHSISTILAGCQLSQPYHATAYPTAYPNPKSLKGPHLEHQLLLLLQLEDALLDGAADHEAYHRDGLVLAQAVDTVLRI